MPIPFLFLGGAITGITGYEKLKDWWNDTSAAPDDLGGAAEGKNSFFTWKRVVVLAILGGIFVKSLPYLKPIIKKYT